ncbi:unannotated protein [freshwater metagenome]|uniref:Unannotated protein n=1 Tax=freshwater metagenome TaxID=449393 RepID=A0A6J6G9I1_9ZZZZ
MRKPIVAKIKPTSPRGNIPTPIANLSALTPNAPIEETSLPKIATALNAAAMPRTFALAILEISVLIPMLRKKIGMKI